MNSLPFQLSAAFLADLEAVLSTADQRELPASFLTDLETVYTASAVAGESRALSGEDFQDLGERLQKWRSHTRSELQRHIEYLSADDPLVCPISLFRTMDFGRLETAHTRVLAWLLDPSKEHGFDSRLAEALLARLTNGSSGPVEVERVHSEYLIGPAENQSAGRIDVVAEGKWQGADGHVTAWLLVIEAKIDAAEGEQQLSRYEEWIDRHANEREVFRVFLTAGGQPAETNRPGQLWESLSFEEMVGLFRAASKDLRGKPGYHLYASTLQESCKTCVAGRCQSMPIVQTPTPWSIT